MGLVSRQVTVKHQQRKQKDAHIILSRSASSKPAENQRDSCSMYTLGTALQPGLCWCWVGSIACPALCPCSRD